MPTPQGWLLCEYRKTYLGISVQRLLENGTYGYLEEIARAEKIGSSFVSRLVRLALLAPDIVEVILEGKQPASLTLKELMAPFPVEWSGQRLQFIVGGRIMR